MYARVTTDEIATIITKSLSGELPFQLAFMGHRIDNLKDFGNGHPDKSSSLSSAIGPIFCVQWGSLIGCLTIDVGILPGTESIYAIGHFRSVDHSWIGKDLTKIDQGELLDKLPENGKSLARLVLNTYHRKKIDPRVTADWHRAPSGSPVSSVCVEDHFPHLEFTETVKDDIGRLYDNGAGKLPDLENVYTQHGDAWVAERKELLRVLWELGSALNQYDPRLLDRIFYDRERFVSK